MSASPKRGGWRGRWATTCATRAPTRSAKRARNGHARRRRSGHTLADLLRVYGEQANPAKSWAPQMEPQIKRVFRPHLDTALAALRVGDLQLTIDGHPKPKSASFGVRCLLTVFRWAVAPGRAYVDRDLLGC